MMLGSLLVLSVSLSSLVAQLGTAELISSLPEQPGQVAFKQYGGYITFTSEGQSSVKSMYYYMQMSSNKKADPRQIPVFIWTNGGPGCSGLLGSFMEMGAFRIQSDGTLASNGYSWNQLAHMVYIEQPVGVGFSYSSDTSDYNTGDTQAVADMYQFILGFLKEYPDLAHNDIYLSSESYGGHYLPLLSQYIIEHNTGISAFRFKGFVLGNPLTDPVEQLKGRYDTLFGHSMIPLPLWQQFQSICDDGQNYDQSDCQDIMNQMDKIIGNIDSHQLNYPVCETADSSSLSSVSKSTAKVSDGGGYLYEPCAKEYLSEYLNRVDVQQAMHAHVGSGAGNWTNCATHDGGVMEYNESDHYVEMEPVYQQLIDGGNDLHILIYSGDDDAKSAALGTQSWIWNLGYKADSPWQVWKYHDPVLGDQVAGFWVRFAHPPFRALTFATVHSAGHAVPWYKPQKAFEMVRKYLLGEF